MMWVKCANDTEKIDAIKKYCSEQLERLQMDLDFLIADSNTPYDYEWEKREIKKQMDLLTDICRIAEVDPLTSILI